MLMGDGGRETKGREVEGSIGKMAIPSGKGASSSRGVPSRILASVTSIVLVLQPGQSREGSSTMTRRPLPPGLVGTDGDTW